MTTMAEKLEHKAEIAALFIDTFGIGVRLDVEQFDDWCDANDLHRRARPGSDDPNWSAYVLRRNKIRYRINDAARRHPRFEGARWSIVVPKSEAVRIPSRGRNQGRALIHMERQELGYLVSGISEVALADMRIAIPRIRQFSQNIMLEIDKMFDHLEIENASPGDRELAEAYKRQVLLIRDQFEAEINLKGMHVQEQMRLALNGLRSSIIKSLPHRQDAA